MSEPIDPTGPASAPSALQFDRAELADASEERQTPACAFCRTPLHASYFDINGQMACESCRFKIEEQVKKGPGMVGFLRAAGAGVGAAIAGCAIYYAVRALTGYEIGLISILVGFMVGKSVRWGSRGRGGWVYQTLAMFLTYMAIVSTYIPLLMKEFQDMDWTVEAPSATTSGSATAPATGPKTSTKPTGKDAVKLTFGGVMLGLIGLFALAAALPFLAGFQNVIGLLIIAFGLWEAWKLNKRHKVEILGPLDLGRASAVVPES